MKTPEELAKKWSRTTRENQDVDECELSWDLVRQWETDSFLAGYNAAKDQYAAKLKEANDTIAGMADECEGLKTIIYDNEDTNLPTPAKWISVKERLPEVLESVIVLYAPTNEAKNDHRMECWNWPELDVYESRFITHWQPLPEPPKEGK